MLTDRRAVLARRAGTLAGGTLAALGVYDAVKETQRLIRKEA